MTVACLFKALPLPIEIRKQVIDELKRDYDFAEDENKHINSNELALLAESPGIHYFLLLFI